MTGPVKELVGAMHIHSTYSDGSLDIPGVCENAESAGLDFILMTDHNTLQPKHDGFEGWHKSLLVVIGFELNDSRNRNHYLVFGIDGDVPDHDDARDFVREVKDKGGIGIVAHPDEDGGYVSELLGAYPWTDWRITDFTGIELWNQMTEWKEGLTQKNKYWRLIHPRRYLKGPKSETITRWDYLMQRRKVIGTGGPDAHAFHYRLFGFIPVCIYPYKVSFKLIRTHVLIPAEAAAPAEERNRESFSALKDALLKNLAYGRMFISNYYLGDARGFRLSVHTTEGEIGMGDTVSWKGKECVMEVSSPLPGSIRLIRNGKQYAGEKGKKALFRLTEEGVYRVEVHRKHKFWIISNPVWMQDFPEC